MGDSWPIQIAKDIKIRKFAVGRARSKSRVKGVAGPPFAEETRCVTHQCSQLSEQKPGTEPRLPKKDLQRPSCSVTPVTYVGTHKAFENVVSAETVLAWTEEQIQV